MSQEPAAEPVEQRVTRLERAVRRIDQVVEATYTFLMAERVQSLKARWERTQQELSVQIRRADLHSHTTYSDGKNSVAVMEEWRQRVGLDLLAITDHNTLNHAKDCAPYPRILVGEEVTGRHHHVLTHGTPELIAPAHELRLEVANIRAAGGMPLVAHPTGWEGNIYNDEKIAAVRELTGTFLMEIGNGAANWYDYRDSTDDTAVGLYDQLLAAGTAVVAVGNSDAHRCANVGMVWNGVPVQGADPATIYEAIRDGQNFVSNGPAVLLWADGELAALKPRPAVGSVQLRCEVADSAGLARWRLVADGRTWKEGDAEGRRSLKLQFDAPATGVRSYRLECVASDGRQGFSNAVRFEG